MQATNIRSVIFRQLFFIFWISGTASTQEAALGENAFYQLTYLAVPAVRIMISVKEKKIVSGTTVYRIVATAKTNSFFSAFYKVDNRYEVDMDSATGLPLRMQKNIFQKTLEQTMTISYRHCSGEAVFEGGKFTPALRSPIHPQAHNFFTMIYWLRNRPLKSGEVFELPLDVETEPWIARIYIEKEETIIMAGKKWKAAKAIFRFIPLKEEVKRKKTDILTRRLVTSKTRLIFWIAKEPPHPFLKVDFEMSPANAVTELETLQYSGF